MAEEETWETLAKRLAALVVKLFERAGLWHLVQRS